MIAVPARAALALVLAALLCVAAAGCASKHRAARGAAGLGSAPRPLGDEDGDGAGASGYFDLDDGAVRHFGHAADARDARAIATLVGRYYAAAAADDGARACSLLYWLVAESLPEEYARPPGPLYLKGADSCPALLTRVFVHFHGQLSVAPKVVAVRVAGDRADALLGWPALPAGYIEARREGSAWKLARQLADPLP